MTELTSFSLLFRTNSPVSSANILSNCNYKNGRECTGKKNAKMNGKCTGRNGKAKIKMAIGTHFVQRSAFKNKSEKRFSFQQPFKFVFATLVHIYLKRKSNKIHPFFFHISQKLKIAKILGMHFLLRRKIRPKFDSH